MKKISFLILLTICAGCNGFLGVNVNPNAPSTATPTLQLAGALITTQAIMQGGILATVNMWAGYWSPNGDYSLSGNQQTSYRLLTSLGNNTWINLYTNISNYNAIIKNPASSPNAVAVAKIMMSLDFQVLVDLFGNVPYSQALGALSKATPAYDDAEVIYDSLNSQLKSAVAIIAANSATSAPLTSTVDVVFQGNMSSWASFANTLRLRMLVRQSNLTSPKLNLTSEAADIVANGYGFVKADVKTQPGYSQNAGQLPPLWNLAGAAIDGSTNAQQYYRANSYSLNNYFLKYKDPRTVVLFRLIGSAPGDSTGTTNAFNQFNAGNPPKNKDGIPLLNGIPFGNPPNSSTYGANVTSGFGVGVLPGPSAPALLMYAAESEFIQAEACLLNYLTGGSAAAQTHYTKGVEASFASLLGPAGTKTAADNFIVANAGIDGIDFTVSPIDAIIKQKWAALTSIGGLEAWSDQRRLQLAVDVPPQSLDPNLQPDPSGTYKYPIRYPYPSSEYSLNPGSPSAEGNITPFSPKIFWSK